LPPSRAARAAEKKLERHRSPIIALARELGLDPRPPGHNDIAWMVTCPGTNHWLMISAGQNEFGCGWCRRKSGPTELRSYCDERRP
jgi:hypothetical protein